MAVPRFKNVVTYRVSVPFTLTFCNKFNEMEFYLWGSMNFCDVTTHSLVEVYQHSSETLVILYQTACFHILENNTLHSHFHEKESGFHNYEFKWKKKRECMKRNLFISFLFLFIPLEKPKHTSYWYYLSSVVIHQGVYWAHIILSLVSDCMQGLDWILNLSNAYYLLTANSCSTYIFTYSLLGSGS